MFWVYIFGSSVYKPFVEFYFDKISEQWDFPQLVYLGKLKVFALSLISFYSKVDAQVQEQIFPLFLSLLFCYSGLMNWPIWNLITILIRNQTIYKFVI